MDLWPIKKALQMWIRYHWKPKGSIDLHLGSKGFFTVVFVNIEDKDRVFEGVPYFYVAAGLYMRPWIMNFVPERETFTSVLVWVRLYSLPLDYWQTMSLTTIGNKLGQFVKASKATRRGKYTSFSRICVEMDLSRALPDEVILEVFDEERVQTIDYEHIPLRCCKCHEHGHLFRDCLLTKIENKSKNNAMKDSKSFHKVANKGKGRKRGSKTQKSEGQQASQNRFQVLEEEEEITITDQTKGEGLMEEGKEEDKEQTQETNLQTETLVGDVETEMDLEMTQSEMEMEDQELQVILEKENLDLEDFLIQGTKEGIDSLPPGLAPRNPGKKRGRKKQNKLLMECGKLMVDSGKMKELTSYSFTNL